MRFRCSVALSLVWGLSASSLCRFSSAEEPLSSVECAPGQPSSSKSECASGQAGSGKSASGQPGSGKSEPGSKFTYFVEGGASIFNSNAGFIRAKAGNVGATYRLGRWHVGASTGFNFWRASLYRDETFEHVGVWNIGPYLEYRMAEDRVRSALLVGASVVVEPSSVDEGPGAPGFFVEVRPLGLRFPLGRLSAVGLDPLSIAIRSPDTRAIPLVEIQFMTWIRWEMNP